MLRPRLVAVDEVSADSVAVSGRFSLVSHPEMFCWILLGHGK
jgi:hypothetical protein